MKYAILSDIHANLQALAAVLDDGKAQQCTHYACLGDIVGNGGKPKECLQIIREMGMTCVRGNFDDYCLKPELDRDFKPQAAGNVKWTRSQLSVDDLDWLRCLELVRNLDGFTIVHATLDCPQRWCYAFNQVDAAANFAFQNTPVCFFGHTHVPIAFSREQTPERRTINGGTYSKFHVDAGKKYFVNPGSVGQPRDNNPKAAYAIYDLEGEIVELRRVDYDIAGAQNDIPPENRTLN